MMSTYYGVRCKDDGAESGCGAPSYNSEALKELAELAPAIASFAKADYMHLVKLAPDFTFDLMDPEAPDLIAFLIAHADHRLEVYDEYGRLPF